MLRALHFLDAEAFEKRRHPGSFHLVARAAPGQFEFRYFCPCGCGLLGSLAVGEGAKPGGDRPSWRWNGSRSEPELSPSVNMVDHWHGWLRLGYWQAC